MICILHQREFDQIKKEWVGWTCNTFVCLCVCGIKNTYRNVIKKPEIMVVREIICI
jgi:hypothetical protein